jgi:phosphoglycolate phosphatase-like HAD superfamily hydrolase
LRDELAVLGACETKPGVPALLAALAARDDVLLGIVSGNLERAAWLKLEAAGLRSYFAAGAFGSDGRRRADLVALAMQRFATRAGRRFSADEVWVIGDTPDDVAGGRAHGTRTLAVATGSFTRDELVHCQPHSLLDDFADTARVMDILCGAC